MCSKCLHSNSCKMDLELYLVVLVSVCMCVVLVSVSMCVVLVCLRACRACQRKCICCALRLYVCACVPCKIIALMI